VLSFSCRMQLAHLSLSRPNSDPTNGKNESARCLPDEGQSRGLQPSKSKPPKDDES
jgi:hypothetical protein